MQFPPAVEILPTGHPANCAVIWLHGLGASADDFVPMVPHLQLPDAISPRFIFPNALSIPVTVNSGYIMPAWYDILDLSLERKVDRDQLLASAGYIQSLVFAEMQKGIPSNRIVVAGFSQGGAVAYEAALTFPHPLAGLIAMSTYLATADFLVPHTANAHLPVAIMHGRHDTVVPEALARKADSTLESLGYRPVYYGYEMDHEVCLEQIADISKCLVQWLE